MYEYILQKHTQKRVSSHSYIIWSEIEKLGDTNTRTNTKLRLNFVFELLIEKYSNIIERLMNKRNNVQKYF